MSGLSQDLREHATDMFHVDMDVTVVTRSRVIDYLHLTSLSVSTMVPQENDLVLENLPNVASPSYDRIIPHVVTPRDVVYNPLPMSMVITKG